MRFLMKTMRTPSYLIILFFGFEALGALIDLSVLAYEGALGARLLVLNVLRFAAPAFLAWLTGTYPLLAVWPSKNVAKQTDVRTFSLRKLITKEPSTCRFHRTTCRCQRTTSTYGHGPHSISWNRF